MAENRQKILQMLADGKISVEEAERLLALVEEPESDDPGLREESASKGPVPKYLRVTVQPTGETGPNDQGRVNIRVPMGLFRAGMKLTALIPSEAVDKANKEMRDRGLNLDLRDLKSDDLEQLINSLADLEVDVLDKDQHVRVYVE